MPFELHFTDLANSDMDELEKTAQAKRLKAVRKALGYPQTNPRHPSLNTHQFTSPSGPEGELEVIVSYHRPVQMPPTPPFRFGSNLRLNLSSE